MNYVDPRFEVGAYICDGLELYEVVYHRAGVDTGFMAARVLVENCRTGCCVEFLAQRVRAAFHLVRAAPAPLCPDLVDEIVWEPAAATG